MSINITTLDNGMRVVSDSIDTVETVSLGVWVDVGTRNEAREVNGVSHILEHMAFKGTRRRTARSIVEEIESVGGNINACTSRDSTAYFVRILKDDIALAIDIISDILQNSVMDSDELALEKTVIIQEINQAKDTPEDAIFDIFQATAFPDQALGRPVLGSLEDVGGMGRNAVIKYMNNNYSGSRMVLSAAGRLDHDRLVDLANKAFSGLSRGNGCSFEVARYVGGNVREERDLEQVHLLLGFDGLAYEDPDFYALSVWSTMFGGGMSSRLFQEIREKCGLVYSIYSFISCYSDGGLFGIYAGTGEKESAELIPLLGQQISQAGEDITDDELYRARSQIKASILMSLESTSARCEQLARQMMVFNRPLPVAELVDKIEKVDGDAIRNLVSRITSAKPTFAALGPISNIPPDF